MQEEFEDTKGVIRIRKLKDKHTKKKDKKTKQQSTKHYTENLKFDSFCLSSGQKHHKLCTKLTLPVYNDSDMLRRKDNISHTG